MNSKFISHTMKQYSITTIFIFMSIFIQNTYAQQTPLFGSTSQFLNVANPSMTKTVNPFNLSLAGRKYWTKIDGSPEAFLGSIALSPENYKSAIGGVFWSEKAPLFSKHVFGLNYAYSVKEMGLENNLRLGAGLDFISISNNTSSILTDDYNDPFYTSLIGNVKSAIDFKAGFTWNNEQLEIGLAMQQMIRSKNTVGEGSNGKLNFDNPMITNGHIKYTIQMDEDVFITPLLYWQTQKNVPIRADINLLAEKTGKLWGGLWLRPKSSMGVLAGIWVLPDVKLGYMYEKTFFNSTTNAGGSHELVLSYTPKYFGKSKPQPEVETNTTKTEVEPKIIRVRDTLVIVKETRVIEKEKRPETITKPKPETDTYTPPTTTETKVEGSRFHVVSGLFSLEKNASVYAQKLKSEGYKTTIIKNPDTNQFYVSVGNFSNIEAARSFVNQNPSDNFKFWVKEIKK